MADSGRPTANPYETASTTGASLSPAGAVLRPLRIWPAIVLLAAIWLLRSLPYLVDDGGQAIFFAAFLGPLALTLVIFGWWLFASRATRRERWLGFAAIVLTGVAATFAAHFSVREGFPLFWLLIPWGITAFTGALIVLHRWRSEQRTLVAVIAGALAFGYWDLVRVNGAWGDFRVSSDWRWEPTAEDLYLAEKKQRDEKQAGDKPDAAKQEEDVATPPAAAEWPEFRGPNRDAHVPGITLATDWEKPDSSPQIAWKQRIGPGWSSFVLAGERLYTQEQRGDDEAVVCLDAGSGREIWARTYPSRFWESIAGAGPRSTPTLSGGRLYAQGAAGLLHCLDPVSGEVIWPANLLNDTELPAPPMWGFSSSPLVTAGVVIVHAGKEREKGLLLGYGVQDGKLKWSVPCGDNCYSSPQMLTIGGRRVAAILTNLGLTAVDPETGKLAWDYEFEFSNYRALQPLQLRDGDLIIPSGMGTGTRRVKLTGDGDEVKADAVWTSKQMRPDFNDLVAHRGTLYGYDRNFFGAADLATGKRLYMNGRFGNGQVLVLPDGDQLLVVSETGEIVLLAANPDELKELAKFKVIEGKTWNHPILVGDRLFLRNGEYVACVKLPVKKADAVVGPASFRRAEQEADADFREGTEMGKNVAQAL